MPKARADALPAKARPVERLFPFVLRARKLLIGRETLGRSKRNLHFVLLTEEMTPEKRDEIVREFSSYPVVQKYSVAQFEQFFGARGARVIGFAKSSLAKSIYAELKEFRVNAPPPDARPLAEAEQKEGAEQKSDGPG